MIRLLSRVWLPVLMCSLSLAPLARAGEMPSCAVEDDVAHLVELVHQRLILAEGVARYKWNHNMAIEDLPREQVIVESLGRRAETAGVSAELAEMFFRAQIEASKAEQRALFERWRQAGIAQFRDAPDLIAVIRPQLDALTPRLIDVLARLWPYLDDTACRQLFTALVREQQAVAEWHSPGALSIATAPIAEVAAID
ncbi:MAG: gamma subclass chorismate mutase AroQ [Bacteroidales bacterium]|nr:gamma subclass chorismate mutase AroQ [Bacteroidales bacterium]